MLSARSSALMLRRVAFSSQNQTPRFVRPFSSKSDAKPVPAKKPAPPPAEKKDEDEDALSPVTIERQAMSKTSKFMVWGYTGEYTPAPVLPDDPAELAALDNAEYNAVARTNMDGTLRTVIIRQEQASMRQSPLNMEKKWKINFYEDGKITEKWTNSLMGWTSNADPYQCAPPLVFENAADAVYFAKKRGWHYVVKRPILRYARDDDAQYQDNFLPQAIAAKVAAEGTNCDQWHRDSAGTSHYMRPLKYHGNGTVRQHGPNCDAPIAPSVPGYYKMR